MSKTTIKDYELFQKWVRHYFQLLGLTEWELYFEHIQLEGKYAESYYKVSDGLCTIVLAKTWDNMRKKDAQSIQSVALHETLHILMAPLTAEAGERYTNQLSIDTAEHLIIRRLEKLVSTEATNE